MLIGSAGVMIGALLILSGRKWPKTTISKVISAFR
jgi:hypothetical protein